MDDDARYERIGDFFGLTHANVLMSINKLKGQVQYNKEFRDDDKKIRKRLTKEMNKINCIYKFT
jgi:phage regulator Rha-like protein